MVSGCTEDTTKGSGFKQEVEKGTESLTLSG